MNTKIIFIMLCMMLHGETSFATILWAGGEDIDFPNGAAPCSDTSTVYRRASYSRTAMRACSSDEKSISTTFSAGPVTSAWLSVRAANWAFGVSAKWIGFERSGTQSNLFIGTDTVTNTKLALWKFNGTTWTKLASEAGTSILVNTPQKYDMQVISYGTSATVNVYVGGAANPVISFTGDVTGGGATNFDSVAFISWNTSYVINLSEIIVSDSDTRSLSLATLAPNAAGDANQWAGTYANINPVTINDSVNISESTSAEDFRANMTNLPSTNFQIIAVKIAARAIQNAGITSLSLGVKTNATIDNPAATSLLTTWGTKETFYTTNPITTAPWTPTEIDALQIHLRSAP